MKIFLAGHNGMVGSAIQRKIGKRVLVADRSELDLENQLQVEAFFQRHKPDVVIMAAAKVGGINANNTQRADFIYNNLQIQNNIIHSSFLNGVKKLLFLGSSCIYPKFCTQPMKEEDLLTGMLEPTNEPYAIAKIAGIKMCESYYRQYGCNFISVMPTNLYGINDNFDLENSHVIPALIRKFCTAHLEKEKVVKIWGTGKVRREFMYVDDMAEACLAVLDNVNAEDLHSWGVSHLNIGTGKDITIAYTAKLISDIVGYEGLIEFDTSKPDGTPKKLLDVSRLNAFYTYKTDLKDGLKKTIEWFKETH